MYTTPTHVPTRALLTRTHTYTHTTSAQARGSARTHTHVETDRRTHNAPHTNHTRTLLHVCTRSRKTLVAHVVHVNSSLNYHRAEDGALVTFSSLAWCARCWRSAVTWVSRVFSSEFEGRVQDLVVGRPGRGSKMFCGVSGGGGGLNPPESCHSLPG